MKEEREKARERERQKERKREKQGEKERERERERSQTCSLCRFRWPIETGKVKYKVFLSDLSVRYSMFRHLHASE